MMKETDVYEEAKSETHKLTKSDRSLIKAYLGYSRVTQLADLGKKKRSEACNFISAALWPKLVRGKKEKQTNQGIADIEVLLKGTKKSAASTQHILAFLGGIRPSIKFWMGACAPTNSEILVQVSSNKNIVCTE